MPGPLILLLLQLASYAAPRAVEHVVHLEVVAGHDAVGERTTISRSGPLIRIDSTIYRRATQTDYIDLANELSVSVARAQDGALRGVTIGRRTAGRRLPPTGRRGRVLGEACTIWRVTDAHLGTSEEICETRDGIPLSEAFWYPEAGDRTVPYRRAILVERRPVPAEVLRPPREILALAAALPPPAILMPVPGPDYEVEMVGDDTADGSYVLRRHGRFSSTTRYEGEGTSLSLGNGAIVLDLQQDGAGRPRSLAIRRVGSRRVDNLVPRWQRLPGRAPEQVLGETCTWQENLAFESDDRSSSCRTADGISLKEEHWFHYLGLTQHFTARRLSRRPLADSDFAPPARALDLSAWGIIHAP